MYRLVCLKPGVAGNSLNGFRGSLMECLSLAGRLHRRLGQVSTIKRWDGSDIRRPAFRLPLP